MDIRIARLRLFAILGLFAFAGCAHPYGLTVAAAPAYNPLAQDFLRARGFTSAPASAGDVLTMERQHADSVERVRFYYGGGSPGFWGSYSQPTSGGGYLAGSNHGVAQNVGYSASWVGSGPTRGPASGLTVELTAYKVDAKGVRHVVWAPYNTLWQFDSLLDVVEQVNTAKK